MNFIETTSGFKLVFLSILTLMHLAGDVRFVYCEIDRQPLDRGVPEAHVFLAGEPVTLQFGEVMSDAVIWRLLDDRGAIVEEGEFKSRDALNLGALPIGWYRLERLNAESEALDWTTAAVLAPLQAPTPLDSPVCVDAAISWFAIDDPEGQERYAQLANLAGVNWIRDRMRWRTVEPEPGVFVEGTSYDSAAEIQHRYGLQVVQVFHDTPPWANPEPGGTVRMPNDLRYLYRFSKAMAKRYAGQVQAWEPWNEANIRLFGGHPPVELASAQKAAYLGFKAGHPEIKVVWNSMAGLPTWLQTRIVLKNEVWPYFDAYNIHTYDWPHAYTFLWPPVHEAASGRPIWVTESDRGMVHENDPPYYELTREGEILKAELLPQAFASSFFAGSAKHFQFILGNYTETQNPAQFGLLRYDFTPRPAYSALAAVGRMLAGANCLGRWEIDGRPDINLAAFRAWPDGVERDVWIAWAERTGEWHERGQWEAEWPFDVEPQPFAVYDYLGRELPKDAYQTLRSAPYFIVMPAGASEGLPLAPPHRSDWREGKPSSIVLQLIAPPENLIELEETRWSHELEYLVEPERDIELDLYIYNFGKEAAEGVLTVERAPEGWELSAHEWPLSLAPMERAAPSLNVRIPDFPRNADSDVWIILRGEFGDAGRPVLAFRLITQAGEGYRAE